MKAKVTTFIAVAFTITVIGLWLKPIGSIDHVSGKEQRNLQYTLGHFWSSSQQYGYRAFSWDSCKPRFPLVLVYNRIPKAGSSTVITLVKNLSSLNHFRLSTPQSHNYMEVEKEIFRALEAKERTLIVNHVKFPEVFHDDQVAYINIMRHPVDRCISWYYYSRYGHPLRQYAKERYGNDTIDECLAKSPAERETCFNCHKEEQARYFCGRADGSCRRAPLEEVFRKARNNMDSHYFVGITERFEETVDTLEKLYPTFFRAAQKVLSRMPPRNVLKNKNEYILPSEASREYIRDWSELEVGLYDHAAQLFQRHRTKCLSEWH